MNTRTDTLNRHLSNAINYVAKVIDRSNVPPNELDLLWEEYWKALRLLRFIEGRLWLRAAGEADPTNFAPAREQLAIACKSLDAADKAASNALHMRFTDPPTV